MTLSSTSPIRRVAVLGAGVMGAQIAAHLSNAGIDTVLFDLPTVDGNPNAIALKGLDNLKQLKPAPLMSASRIDGITPANYASDLALLADCDLVIEAIAERLDWKADLYAKIAPILLVYRLKH